MIVTDTVPPSTERDYRTRGVVHVTLADGTTAQGRAFEKHKRDATPSEHIVRAVLNGLPYGFPCSANRKGRGAYPVNCAYFEHMGRTLFFYTAGGVLADGARVVYVEAH